MRRILILTGDKTQAVHFRALLESFRAEFEIAIGEDIARSILSQRYMNMILIDASTLKLGSSWVFNFLANRGLQVPIVILGADASAVTGDLPESTDITCVPPPIDIAKLESILKVSARI